MSEANGGAPVRRRGRLLHEGGSIRLLDLPPWIGPSEGSDEEWNRLIAAAASGGRQEARGDAAGEAPPPVQAERRAPAWAKPLAPLDEWLRRADAAVAGAAEASPEREPDPGRDDVPIFLPLVYELPEDPERAIVVRTPSQAREYALRLVAQAFRQGRDRFEPVDGLPGFARGRGAPSLAGFFGGALAGGLSRAFPHPQGAAFATWAGYPWTSTRTLLFARPFGADELRVEAVELAEGLRLYVRLERDCWCGIGIVAFCEGLAPEAADAAFCEAFRRTAGAAFDCPWPAASD